MSKIRQAVTLALASLTLPASAVDFTLGDGMEAKFNSTLTFGSTFRTEAADPSVYGSLAGPLVGLPAGQLGANAGSSDLNFQKNKAVSTVFKASADLELKREGFGVFVRATAWEDTELKNGNRAYGNTANGFTQNVPLSDNGFAPEAKFSNVQATEAFVFGRLTPATDMTLDTRIGRQVVNWGVAQGIAGGINSVNPINIAAQQRPGALAVESRVPVGMVYADLANGKQWGIDGFAQYEFRANAVPGCGTFLMVPNYLPTGCNYVSVLPNINDPTALATGRYAHRNADIDAKDSGQFGLSLRMNLDSVNTDVRVYATNLHNRTPGLRVTNANIAGATTTAAAYGPPPSAATGFTRLTDPNGLKYGLVYAEDIHMFGVSFDTKLDPTLRFYGEVAYRPNQALNLNASDLIAAFLGRSPNSALNLAKNTNAIPPGGTFDGYDRFKVSTASIGSNKVFPQMAGAERVTLSGELGWSHVSGLPDPGVLRYGRSDFYGVAAVNGQPCVDTTVAQKNCSHDGFVTSNAWGYRLRLGANYPAAVFGATLLPSLTFAHSVDGNSYDGTFLQDRKVLIAGLRAEWLKQYFAEMQYTRTGGGAYNPTVDRDTASVVVGIKF